MFTIQKTALKFIIPQSIVRWIRGVCVKNKQKKCSSELNWIVGSLSGDLLREFKPLKKLEEHKIIWQYWAQGFESTDMPDLVKICLRSVELHNGGYTLIRISDKNINEYIEIPDWVRDRMTIMSKAHFSDLLRCVILSLYGGLWLDAAVFLSGDIPQYICENDFFMYRRDEREKNKVFWENTFAYYWGYSPDFAVKSLIGIMYSLRGGRVVSDFAEMLLMFWKNYDYSPDYFFFQILIEEYFKQHPEWLPIIVNDTIPHLLRQYINETPAPGYSVSDILGETTVHSLNYKSQVACENLLSLFPEYIKYLNSSSQ